MSAPSAPGRARALATAGWGSAARGAVLAFVAVASLAGGAALAVSALGGIGLPLAGALRVGGAYLAIFHRVPLRVTAEGGDLWLAAIAGAPADTRSLDVRLTLAPLLVTALAGWLLWRAGRATAETVGGSPGARAIHGAKVAPVYALLVLAATLPARVVLAPVALDLRAELSVPPLPAFLLPLALAAVAGAAGGWWAAGAGGWVRAALAGGWVMLVSGLALALAGLFVAGVVRPDGPEALLTPTTERYVRAVLARPSVGAAALAHHVAALPNEATWVLGPAMGGCTGSYPGPGPLLCYGRFPLAVRLPSWLLPRGAEPAERTRFGPAPWPYLLFLLVPVAASALGGRRAAAEAAPTARIAAGIGAGVAFAALVLAVGWGSSVSVSSVATTAEGVVRESSIRVGPDLVSVPSLALGWGVAGGALGAAFTGKRTGAR